MAVWGIRLAAVALVIVLGWAWLETAVWVLGLAWEWLIRWWGLPVEMHWYAIGPQEATYGAVAVVSLLTLLKAIDVISAILRRRRG